MRNLVIGDIHGCYLTFKKLLKKAEFSKDDNLYILGDMINRGTKSDQVIDLIIKKQDKGYNIFPIRGNHEQMILNLTYENRFLIEKYTVYYKSTNLLDSHGNFKNRYIRFFKQLPYFLENDKNIFVHAALDLTKENIFENKHFMLYSRHQQGKTKNLKGKQLIHGHVPQTIENIKEQIEKNKKIVGIDNGCVFGQKKKGFGKLVCLDTESMEIFTQKNIDE